MKVLWLDGPELTVDGATNVITLTVRRVVDDQMSRLASHGDKHGW